MTFVAAKDECGPSSEKNIGAQTINDCYNRYQYATIVQTCYMHMQAGSGIFSCVLFSPSVSASVQGLLKRALLPSMCRTTRQFQ